MKIQSDERPGGRVLSGLQFNTEVKSDPSNTAPW